VSGLDCEFELKGLFSSKSYAEGKFVFSHQLFVVKASNPQGELLEKTKKGENTWFAKEEVESLKILPNIPHLIKIANSDTFSWVEADRSHGESGFDIEIRNVVEF
jgi:hypothetical protein